MINSEYLLNLNNPQKEAVLHLEGPLLIVAGAGSGKTKVLTSRIAHIIKEKKAFPNQILSVTFTNKAAKEMQNRVSSILKSEAIGLSWLSRYGQCRYTKKEIGLTKKLALINTIEESKDVVLHEIAHALTGRGHGHDFVWKRMCRKVGARPERCYTPEDKGGSVKTLQGKYKLVNKDTGKVYRYYHRKPRRTNWDGVWLRGKKRETENKLQVVANQINNTDSSPYRIKS